MRLALAMLALFLLSCSSGTPAEIVVVVDSDLRVPDELDEIEIVVQNVSLSDLTTTPFKAAINFQKVVYSPGTRHERARETFVAHVDFVLRDRVPNAFVRVNPLGLQVSYLRVDQAFQEAGR